MNQEVMNQKQTTIKKKKHYILEGSFGFQLIFLLHHI